MKLLCVLAVCVVGAYAQVGTPSLGSTGTNTAALSGSSLNNAFKNVGNQLLTGTTGGLSGRSFSSPMATTGSASFASSLTPGFPSTSGFPSTGQFSGSTMSSPAYTSGAGSLAGFTSNYVTPGAGGVMGTMTSPSLSYPTPSLMPHSAGMNYATSTYTPTTMYNPFGNMAAAYPMQQQQQQHRGFRMSGNPMYQGTTESRVLGILGGGSTMSMFPGMASSPMYANAPIPNTGANMCYGQIASAASPSPVNWANNMMMATPTTNMMMPSNNYASTNYQTLG